MTLLTRPTAGVLSLLLHSLSSKVNAYPAISRNMSTRTYKDAIEHLNSLQSNAAALETARLLGARSAEIAIPEMLEYLDRTGRSVRLMFCVLLLSETNVHRQKT